MVKIFPSLISAHLLTLQREIELLEPYVQGFHIDIMDFHFVPNLTWGPAFVNSIRSATKKQLQIHLMVDYPERYFDRLELSNDDIVSMHYESPSAHSLDELLKELRSRNLQGSIALNPETPLEVLSFDHIDHILLMSVHPGFSGQSFIPETMQKLEALAALRAEKQLNFTIGLDGGVNETNCTELRARGADELAIASAIFKHNNRIEAVKNIIKLCNR